MSTLPPEAHGLFILLGLIGFFLLLVLCFIAWVALRDETDPHEKCEREKERLLVNADRELERRPILNLSTERTS